MDFRGEHARTNRPRFSHPVLFALSILLAPALWIGFVATTNPHELLVGVFASVASVAFALFVCRASGTRLTLLPRDLAQSWRVPWYMLSGSVEITLVLLKDLLHLSPAKDLFRVCGFDASNHDPVRGARTVMAVAFTTTAPNFIVVDVDPAQSRMLFHQIERSSVPRMTQALGAKS